MQYIYNYGHVQFCSIASEEFTMLKWKLLQQTYIATDKTNERLKYS